jgi:hypothetical protein
VKVCESYKMWGDRRINSIHLRGLQKLSLCEENQVPVKIGAHQNQRVKETNSGICLLVFQGAHLA